MPVVTFFGDVLIIFWVFRLPIVIFEENLSIKSKFLKKRGGWDLNPRVISDMGLAIPRPTRLGDPRTNGARMHTVNKFTLRQNEYSF